MGRSITALDDLTVNNLGVFKKINEVSLPTRYPQSWYTASLESSDVVVQLGFYSELPVGAIRARSFNNNQIKSSFAESINSTTLQKTPNCMYIESFAVLEKYRNLGIGSELLSWVIEETKKRFIHEIIIHVQATNENAISWYLKKGFKKQDLVEGYYKEQGLEAPDAYILKHSV
ncbi:NAT5 [Candida margitis]|uniref:NAT5 n=1 Tax=Candida margitis TaxID=1775924 RepID=UPI002226E809|nr:NAT5 [Candida margitis]KAI5969678.1 NAT5 [Candida margitis]